MSQLIINLPPQKVWVRKEYLRDLQDGFGEFVEGVWVSVKSIPGRAFYFETYLPKYGAMFDKLPISAFLARPELPDPDLDLPNLQFWNCMDYGVRCLEKSFITSMDFEVRTRNFGTLTGAYRFTLDNFHPDLDTTNCNVSEIPDEHKSHNCIELENGQFCLYPNNRTRIYDLSLTPETPLVPDFKVSTHIFQVEQGVRWGRLGDTNEYFWKTDEEKDEDFLKSVMYQDDYLNSMYPDIPDDLNEPIVQSLCPNCGQIPCNPRCINAD